MPSPMDSRALRALRGESEPPPAAGSSDDPLVGALVAERYRVVRKLGEGAQASVYVAKHTLIKRLVALKVLSTTMSTDHDLVHRFLDEGQVAGTMKHPNIVESLDMGVTEDGRPYLVLEYLEGSTVADDIYQRGSLDLGRAAFIGVQIASALAAAHARGVVHRDLKPENVILIDHEGHGDHAKVLDFGISKLESREEASVRASLVIGTPDYMAPEQVSDPASVDGRADVFALGAMLYEMLAGRSPLVAKAGDDVLDLVLRHEPTPLAELRPDLPPSLVEAIERAMHKDRAERTQSIAELGAALNPFVVISAPRSADSIPIAGITIPSLPKISGVQSVSELESARLRASPGSGAPVAPSSSIPARPSGAPVLGLVLDEATDLPARSGRSRLALVAVVLSVLAVGALAVFLLLRPHAPAVTAPTEPLALDNARPASTKEATNAEPPATAAETAAETAVAPTAPDEAATAAP